MPNAESNLSGTEQPVHSQTAYSGEQILITPSKLIVEQHGSTRGRAIILSKISMLRKRELHGEDMFIVGLFSLLSAITALVTGGLFLTYLFGPEPIFSLGPLIVGVLSVGFTVLSALLLYQIYFVDHSPPEGVVWLTIRAPEGGVGFKIEEEDISRLVSEIDAHTEQEVTVKG